MNDADKARVFLKAVDEEADWGGHWIDFSARPDECSLGEAFEAALRILREALAPEEANA